MRQAKPYEITEAKKHAGVGEDHERLDGGGSLRRRKNIYGADDD